MPNSNERCDCGQTKRPDRLRSHRDPEQVNYEAFTNSLVFHIMENKGISKWRNLVFEPVIKANSRKILPARIIVMGKHHFRDHERLVSHSAENISIK
ncbi:hypothetical protein Y032_0562g3503 [Ancylostoma ceylanicum]|uniref:Uncharacterized protein n=1 Tax=Ancylostoma ceylanicum TaxID=53326 RepID=A0A016WPA0_9BILA|nr:hypothetical protein Y032_0562g3503 [Ancylostoma ceylanicum]